jgi:hypothetical protein
MNAVLKQPVFTSNGFAWDGSDYKAPSLFKIQHPFRARRSLCRETDLSSLRGASVVVIADDENLRIGALKQRHRFSYRFLLESVSTVAKTVTALAVITAPPEDNGRMHYLEARGWEAVVLPRESRLSANGPQMKTNVDVDLAIEVGFRLATTRFDVLLVASGDGDLCVSIARAVGRHRPSVRVVTLAVPGSASRELSVRKELFDGHIAAGSDLMRPIRQEQTLNLKVCHV